MKNSILINVSSLFIVLFAFLGGGDARNFRRWRRGLQIPGERRTGVLDQDVDLNLLKEISKDTGVETAGPGGIAFSGRERDHKHILDDDDDDDDNGDQDGLRGNLPLAEPDGGVDADVGVDTGLVDVGGGGVKFKSESLKKLHGHWKEQISEIRELRGGLSDMEEALMHKLQEKTKDRLEEIQAFIKQQQQDVREIMEALENDEI